jgi:hypothetical protein
MAETGKNAILEFGTTFGPADCLQGGNISDAVEDITYYCNGFQKHIAGVRIASLDVSMALPETNMTTVMSYIYPGANSTSWIWRPSGHSTGSKTRLKYTSTKAHCLTANVSAPINGVITLDATFVLDDLTIAAATT